MRSANWGFGRGFSGTLTAHYTIKTGKKWQFVRAFPPHGSILNNYGNELSAFRICCLTRNHNPRVGGSNPSAATFSLCDGMVFSSS